MLKKLIIKNRQGLYALPLEDIIFMEKDLRKIRLYTPYLTVEFYGKFDEITPFLDKRFMYCHRSYIINMEKILLMAGNQIFVTAKGGGIPFGRDTFGRAKKIYARYVEEKSEEKRSGNR